MSKIAVLLPKEYMLEQARKVIQEKNADIDILKVIKTSDSVYEARKAMEQGAGIIVARGVQAAYIREDVYKRQNSDCVCYNKWKC